MPAAIPIIIAAGASAATAAGAAGVGVLGATAFTIAGASVSIGAVVGAALSLAATFAGALLNKPPDVGSQSVEATVPRIDPRPPKRRAFGRYRFGGRRIMSITQGRDLYSAYLIASHPMEIGNDWTLFIDDREAEVFDGDPFDMEVGGRILEPQSLDRTIVWISGGDHTKAPQQWLDEGVIEASDRWDGLSMIWVTSRGARAQDFNVMYPRGANREVQILCDGGRWIDPETQIETFTATPARIAYALMRDDLGLAFDPSDLDAQSFAGAALIEGPVFEMNGVLDATSDRGDFIAAVQNVAASSIVFQSGKWAYIPGVARQSVMTLEQDMLAGPPRITLIGEPDEKFNTVEGSFVDPDFFTVAPNPLFQDEEALLEDGEERLQQPQHTHVTNPIQSQRLDRLGLRRTRRQRGLSASFSGRAIFLTEGDVVTTNFGLPFWQDGMAIVRRARTEIEDSGGQPVEVNQMELLEYDPSDFEFDVTTDYIPYTPLAQTARDFARYSAPIFRSVAFLGSGSMRAAEMTLDPIAQAAVLEWQYTLNGGSNWIDLPEIRLSESGTSDNSPVMLRQEALPSGANVRWRFRSAGGESLTSNWTETTDYLVPGSQQITAPNGSASATFGNTVTTAWAIPNDPRIDQLEIYRIANHTEIDPLQGSRIAFVAADAGAEVIFDDEGLPPGNYRYWARCYGGPLAGSWSAPLDQTF